MQEGYHAIAVVEAQRALDNINKNAGHVTSQKECRWVQGAPWPVVDISAHGEYYAIAYIDQTETRRRFSSLLYRNIPKNRELMMCLVGNTWLHLYPVNRTKAPTRLFLRTANPFVHISLKSKLNCFRLTTHGLANL